jgi:hypothetical protein
MAGSKPGQQRQAWNNSHTACWALPYTSFDASLSLSYQQYGIYTSWGGEFPCNRFSSTQGIRIQNYSSKECFLEQLLSVRAWSHIVEILLAAVLLNVCEYYKPCCFPFLVNKYSDVWKVVSTKTALKSTEKWNISVVNIQQPPRLIPSRTTH